MKRIFTPAKKKTILLVDDDQFVVYIYREQFQRDGFNVEVANDGESALQMIKKDPFDLVILDLCLPKTNGVEVLTNIRSQFTPEALPVIAFSNAYLGKLMQAALEAGATQCIAKADSTPARIVAIVRKLLVTKAATTDQGLSERFEREHQAKLAADFFASGPQRIVKLRNGSNAFVKSQEESQRLAELLEMHGHARLLAGASGVVGFRKIAQLASALEALLFQLSSKPANITSSTIRTISQAVDLLTLLLEHATNLECEEPPAPAILVVDDEAISRQTVCSALKKANLCPVSTDDSLEAEKLLARTRFDLIFLDVEMPGKSGLELCASIRKMNTNGATPVVFVTSHSDFGSRAKSTLSGGNDFIAKPFLAVELALKALTWFSKETVAQLAVENADHADAPGQETSEAEPNRHFTKEKNQNEAAFLARS